MSPEFELLAEVSRGSPDIALLYPKGEYIDWDRFLALVDRHRVAPMAAHALLRMIPDGEVAEQLQIRQRRAAQRALRHASATIRLVCALRELNIDAIPLKGPLLSDQLYGNAALRDVRDADLLIRPADLAATDALLLRLGYQRVEPIQIPKADSRAMRRLLRQAHHFEYRHAVEQVSAEIHWRMAGWDTDAVERLWRAAEVCQWAGTPVLRIQDNELLFLLLCDHGAGHKWFLLKWLADVAILLPQVDSFRLAELARELDLERPLWQAARLLQGLFGIEIPKPLANGAAGARVRWLEAEAMLAMRGECKAHFEQGKSLSGWLRNWRYARRLRISPQVIAFPRLDDFHLPLRQVARLLRRQLTG